MRLQSWAARMRRVRPDPFVASPYTTNFPLTENPISEGGIWSEVDTTRTKMRTSGGLCFGTQTGGGSDDSQCKISGFGTNYEIKATIFRSASIVGADNYEIGLCGRCTETSGDTLKYEPLINKDGGMQMMRWNAGMTFTDIGFSSGSGSTSAPQTGDIIRVTYVGSLITIYHRPIATGIETQIGQQTDATYATGDPGLNSYINTPGDNPAHFCFSSVTITAL